MSDKNFARNKIMFWFRFDFNIYSFQHIFNMCILFINIYIYNAQPTASQLTLLPTHDFCITSDIYSIYFAFILFFFCYFCLQVDCCCFSFTLYCRFQQYFPLLASYFSTKEILFFYGKPKRKQRGEVELYIFLCLM